jgi:hypothetical protein
MSRTESTIADESLPLPASIAKRGVEAGRTMVEGAEALGHDVAQTVANGVTVLADPTRSAGVAIGDSVRVEGSPDPGEIVLEPNLASEHKAKQIADQETLAGYGVVSTEGRPRGT